MNFSKITIFILGIFILLLTIILLSYHYSLITFPFQLEFREGAVYQNTKALISGINPYVLSNQPQYFNVYGFVYNFIVYLFSILFGLSLILHRSISAFFIFASCAIVFFQLKRKKIWSIYIIIAMLFLYISLLFGVQPIARSDVTGLFFFLSSIFLLKKYNYSFLSIVASVILGWIAFYTKQYFGLFLPYLTIYLFLFVSKRKSILYGTISLIFFGFTYFIINSMFPTYFRNIFDMNIKFSVEHLLVQVSMFMFFYVGIIFILFLIIIYKIYKIKITIGLLNKVFKLDVLYSKINIVNFDKPLINNACDISLFCFVCSIVLVFWLAGNIGAFMIYFFQLIAPFFIIVVFDYIRKQKISFLILLVINLYLASFISLEYFKLKQCLFSAPSKFKKDLKFSIPKNQEANTLENWKYIRDLILTHTNVLNNPIVTSILVNQEKKVYDSGLSDGFLYGINSKSLIHKYLLPPDEDVQLRYNKFLNEINCSIKQQEFDLIIYPNTYIKSKKLLEQYYEIKETKSLLMRHCGQKWKLEIWIPKKLVVL